MPRYAKQNRVSSIYFSLRVQTTKGRECSWGTLRIPRMLIINMIMYFLIKYLAFWKWLYTPIIIWRSVIESKGNDLWIKYVLYPTLPAEAKFRWLGQLLDCSFWYTSAPWKKENDLLLPGALLITQMEVTSALKRSLKTPPPKGHERKNLEVKRSSEIFASHKFQQIHHVLSFL